MIELGHWTFERYTRSLIIFSCLNFFFFCLNAKFIIHYFRKNIFDDFPGYLKISSAFKPGSPILGVAAVGTLLNVF